MVELESKNELLEAQYEEVSLSAISQLQEIEELKRENEQLKIMETKCNRNRLKRK